MDLTAKALAENLKRLREARKLTQAELADSVSVTSHTIQNWENGRRFPRGELLERVAASLGVSPGTLMMAGGERPKIVVAQSPVPSDLVELLEHLNEREIGMVRGFLKGLIAGRTSRKKSKSG